MNLTIEPYKPRRKLRVKGTQKPRSAKKKEKTVSSLMKEADRLFSLKVRYGTNCYGSDGEEINQCFTCEKTFSAKKLQNGHYLSRFYKAARWDFDNARPQCMMCNMWKRGDLVVYRQNLVKEIGLERVEAVEAKRQVSFKLTKEYLTALIASLS